MSTLDGYIKHTSVIQFFQENIQKVQTECRIIEAYDTFKEVKLQNINPNLSLHILHFILAFYKK